MNEQELMDIAKALAVGDKGLLAMYESTPIGIVSRKQGTNE